MLNHQIADLIEAEIPQLIEVWVDAVRADPRILSDDDLSEGGLVSHLPQVLTELCAVLRAGETPTTNNTHEARVSAYARFRIGYRARDLASELSILRVTLMNFLDRKLFVLAHSISVEEYMRANYTLHLYIDEEIRYAFSIYTEPRA
jgi:hypothetical protein